MCQPSHPSHHHQMRITHAIPGTARSLAKTVMRWCVCTLYLLPKKRRPQIMFNQYRNFKINRAQSPAIKNNRTNKSNKRRNCRRPSIDDATTYINYEDAHSNQVRTPSRWPSRSPEKQITHITPPTLPASTTHAGPRPEPCRRHQQAVCHESHVRRPELLPAPPPRITPTLPTRRPLWNPHICRRRVRRR